MILLRSILFLLSCFMIGFAFMPRKAYWLRDSAINLGIGFGVVSYTFFLLKWIHPSTNFAIVQWALFLGALALVVIKVFTGAEYRLLPMAKEGVGVLSAFPFVLLFVAAVAVIAYIGLREVVALPHGEWDAWAIWNLHARFLARGVGDWTALFSPALAWTHPDYPLFLPALIAAGWRFSSAETVVIPVAITLLFCVSTVALLVGAVHTEADRVRALAAGLVLLATPKFWLNGTIQTADVPLAFFILVTVVLLWVSGEEREYDVARLAQAGFAASVAAWTKNEGILFVAVLVPAWFCVRFIQNPPKRAVKELGLFVAGAAPGLALLAAFKTFLAPRSEFAGGLARPEWLDFSRYRQVVSFMIQSGRNFGGDNGFSPGWLLVLCIVLFGLAIRRETRRSLAAVVAAIALTIVGYSLIYLLSPYALEWHVQSSFDRLLIQLWPTALFTLFSSLGAAHPVTEKQSIARRWLYAAAPIVALVAAFIIVFRTIPNPSASSSVPAIVETSHFVEILPTSEFHNGWADLKSSGEPAAWMIQDYQPSGGSGTDVIAAPVHPAQSGIVPLFDLGRLGIAMVNPNDEAATVHASCDNQGEVTFSIAAHQKLAAFVGEAPFELKSCTSVLRFNASQELGTMAIFTSGPAGKEVLTEIPVAIAETNERQNLHIPYVVADRGLPLALVLANPDKTPISGTYRIFDSDGAGVLDMPYRIGALTVERFQLPDGFVVSQTRRIEVSPKNGSVAPNAFVTMRGAIVVRGEPADIAFRFVFEKNDAKRLESSLALVNPGDRKATVHVEFDGSDQSEDRTIVVPPHGQVVEPAVHRDSKGLGRLISDEPVALTIVRTRLAFFSTVSAIREHSTQRAEMQIFPHVVIGNGYTTEFALAEPEKVSLH